MGERLFKAATSHRLDLNVSLNLRADDVVVGLLTDILGVLHAISRKEGSIMAGIAEANAALQRINDATNQMGVALGAESTTLQQVSDNLDRMIGELQNLGVPQDLIDKLQSQADATDAIGKTVQAHADFAAQLAARGATDPVPVAPPQVSQPAFDAGNNPPAPAPETIPADPTAPVTPPPAAPPAAAPTDPGAQQQ